MIERELWRVIPSLGDVLASTYGRVMRIPYLCAMPYGGLRHTGGTPTYGQWDGARYLLVHRGRCHKVARLVCEAFHGPAPEDRPVCMHLDENPLNNRPGNLAWGTQRENLNAPGFLAYCRRRTGDRNPYRIAMKQREAAIAGTAHA